MSKTKIYQIVRQAIEVEWDDDDLITPQEAADLRGDNYVTNIIDMMDSGTLPRFQYVYGVKGKIQKYTSRKAVEALNKSDRPNFKHNSSYIGSSPLIEDAIDAIAVPA